MKKILFITILWVLLLFADANNVAAQTRFGYFDQDYVISLMPGIGRIDTLLAVYEQDSLGQQYQALVKEYCLYDSLLKVRECGFGRKESEIKKENEKIFRTAYILQNWMQYSRQAMQAKQKELIQPFYDKVIVAYQDVIDEGKYTYVFKRGALLYAPQSDNLMITVIKKLGIKVTDEILSQASPSIPRTLTSPKFRFNIRK